jgi:ClpA/ClpB-like protein
MIQLGSMTDKFSDTGQKVARRAIEVSKSRNHNFLSLFHIFTALTEVESDLLAEAMRAVGVDPDSVARLLDQELSRSPRHAGVKMAIPEPTRDLFNRALRRARSQGRQQIESYDLFAALFTDIFGGPAEILRRLGADLAMAVDAISVAVRPREQQTLDELHRHNPQHQRILGRSEEASRVTFRKHTPIFKISRLTADLLNSIVTIREKGLPPSLWETADVSLTEQERQGVEAVASSLLHKSVVQMNEATIWSRAIYPLLVLAEQGKLEAWSQLHLKAQYPGFGLEGVADGVIGYNLSGLTKSICLVVQVKRESEAQDPLVRFYSAMLAAARMNWERDNRVANEIFGCYIIADNWTFAHGVISDVEAERPTITVASSREYAEKVEAETILRILKSITSRYSQDLTDAT